MRALRLQNPAVWTQDPRAADLLDDLPVGELVYDLTDDWAAFETDPARRAAVQGRIKSLAARAEVVFACSRPLENGARAWSSRVHYLPNGVDPAGDTEPAPADLRSLQRPRLGYVGTLHSSRLDVELLAVAAELRPAWSFVLVGPDQLEERDRERLGSLANVHYLGQCPHDHVQRYLEAMDVCLIPHHVTEFTRSLDPLKLYEYLAGGRPVIATPVDNAPDLQAFIATAATPQELVEQAERALAEERPELAAARRAAVAGATWEARAKDVEAALGVISPPPASEPSVCAVIVNYNTRDLLEKCLSSLLAAADVKVHTIVVDNASTDGSVELVRTRFPEVEVIQLAENAGFARANNVAFTQCEAEYVLLLNSDAFLAEGALNALLDAAGRYPRAGVLGPRLHYSDGTLQRSAWPFPRAGRIMLEAFGVHRVLRRLGLLEDLGVWGHDEERRVDFLIGACLLLRAKALADVGGFDEDFWLYGEEADLQRRLAEHGWDVIFTPSAHVEHVGGASSSESEVRLRHFYSGQRRFLKKHGARVSWPIARAALLIGSVLRGRWAAARVALTLRS
jgi:GT2 family glycosyltransferase